MCMHSDIGRKRDAYAKSDRIPDERLKVSVHTRGAAAERLHRGRGDGRNRAHTIKAPRGGVEEFFNRSMEC